MFSPEAETSGQRAMLCGGSGCYSIASSPLIHPLLGGQDSFSEGPAHFSFGAGRRGLLRQEQNLSRCEGSSFVGLRGVWFPLKLPLEWSP